MKAFRLTADNALLFFEICHELDLNTEEERWQVMNYLVNLGKVEQVIETPKTKEEYLEHLAKNFKVAYIKSNGSIGYRMPDDQKGDSNGTDRHR